MGRKAKYTSAKALSKGISKYFNSISYIETTEQRNANGEFYTRRVWLESPSLGNLCLSLGIDQSTWGNYKDASRHPDFAPVCERAKLVIQQYLYELSLTKDCKGAIFNLQANYGFSTKSEVEVGAETRKSMEEAGMSLSDKIAAIAAAAELAKNNADADGD